MSYTIADTGSSDSRANPMRCSGNLRTSTFMRMYLSGVEPDVLREVVAHQAAQRGFAEDAKRRHAAFVFV
jgi:hypothetical protein